MFLVFKVVLGPVSHLYFDHPYEPNPEENGLYWATRYTDTRKVFSFEPENIYRAIQVKKTGEPIDQKELCGRYSERCPPIQRPENIKGSANTDEFIRWTLLNSISPALPNIAFGLLNDTL